MISDYHGKFIVFDGCDGAGKSSVITDLVEKLVTYQKIPREDILVTRDPGGDPVGEQIRKILLTNKGDGLDTETEFLLFNASRNQLDAKIIKPALEAGKLVICDRFYYSTIAYQIFGRLSKGKDFSTRVYDKLEILEHLNTMMNTSKPNLSFILTVEPEIGLARSNKAILNTEIKKGEDRFEKLGLDFHKFVLEGYIFCQRFDPNVILIDTTEINLEETTKECYDFILEKI